MKAVVLHQADPDLGRTNALVRNAIDTERELVRALRRSGAECASVFLDKQMQFVGRLHAERPDIVVNVCDLGFDLDPTLEPHVAAILDTMRVPYTGSNYLTLALTNDKLRCKQALALEAIATPAAIAARPGSRVRGADITLPVICKPLSSHNSVDIDFASVLYDAGAVERRLEEIERGTKDFLLEQFIDGREVIGAFLGNGDDVRVLPFEEIVFGPYFDDKPAILTYDSKWTDDSPAAIESKVVIPARLSPEQETTLRDAVVRVVRAFGIRDYGRVDFRLDKAGRFYVIDVNANPDLGPSAGLAKMALASGLDYAALVHAVVMAAQRRLGI